MDHGADGRRTFHRVRQPDVQRELRRFTNRADDQEDADQRSGAPAQPAEQDRRGRRQRVEHLLVVEDVAEAERAGAGVQVGDAEQHDHVGDAGRREGFDRRFVGAFLLEPEADQHVRAQAHDFPADEQQQQVIRHHQRQHRAREQGDQAEEARLARVVRHVANRVDEDHRTRQRHHDQHDHRQRVDQHAHLEGGQPGVEPVAGTGEDVLRPGARRRRRDRPPPARSAHANRIPLMPTTTLTTRLRVGDDRHEHPLVIRVMSAVFLARRRDQLAAVGQQRDDQERQQRSHRDQPGRDNSGC